MRREIAGPLVLSAILLLVSGAAYGANVMRLTEPNGDYVRLFTSPCANDAILARTPPQYCAQLRAGEAKIDSKMHGMCWLALPDRSVGIVYDDGDQGRLPMDAFKPEVDA